MVEQFNFEQKRIDARTALICAVLANCHRDPKKRAYTTEDFMPRYGTKKAQTPEEIFAIVKSWQTHFERN